MLPTPINHHFSPDKFRFKKSHIPCSIFFVDLCTDTTYSVRNVIQNFFVSNGSTASVWAIDLSNAFDRMNHYALLIKLMDWKISYSIVNCFRTIV